MIAETEIYKNNTIEIHYDENSESPREWDNICVIHVAHRRYNFGDKNYNDYESIKKAEKEALKNGDIVLPFLYHRFLVPGIVVKLVLFKFLVKKC